MDSNTDYVMIFYNIFVVLFYIYVVFSVVVIAYLLINRKKIMAAAEAEMELKRKKMLEGKV